MDAGIQESFEETLVLKQNSEQLTYLTKYVSRHFQNPRQRTTSSIVRAGRFTDTRRIVFFSALLQ